MHLWRRTSLRYTCTKYQLPHLFSTSNYLLSHCLDNCFYLEHKDHPDYLSHKYPKSLTFRDLELSFISGSEICSPLQTLAYLCLLYCMSSKWNWFGNKFGEPDFLSMVCWFFAGIRSLWMSPSSCLAHLFQGPFPGFPLAWCCWSLVHYFSWQVRNNFWVWKTLDAEAPILWPPDAKNWLIWKDPEPGKDWGQEEKRTTEDEMVGLHQWFNGHEFEQTLGASEGQGSLVGCSPWGLKESGMTEQLNNNHPIKKHLYLNFQDGGLEAQVVGTW